MPSSPRSSTPPTALACRPWTARRSSRPSRVSSSSEANSSSSSRTAAPTTSANSSSTSVPASARWPSSATATCWLALLGSRSPSPPAMGLRDLFPCQRVSLQPRLEPKDRLCVQLRHPRLGHAEDLTNLAQGQVLVVVERHHQLLPLRQARDGVRETVLHLGGGHLLRGVSRLRVLDRVEQGDLVAGRVRDGPELVERDHGGVGDAHQRRLEVVDRDVELLGHLLVGGRAVQLVLELGVGPLDLARLGAHRARHPVERAQLVDDRALDARDREGLELDLALEIEALDRSNQAEEAVGDEVRLL